MVPHLVPYNVDQMALFKSFSQIRTVGPSVPAKIISWTPCSRHVGHSPPMLGRAPRHVQVSASHRNDFCRIGCLEQSDSVQQYLQSPPVALVLPVDRNRCVHSTTEATLTPKISATARQVRPASTAATTRSPQIEFERSCHVCWPPRPAHMMNHIRAPL